MKSYSIKFIKPTKNNFSVEQESKIKDLYSQLQSAVKSENSSIQKNPKKNWAPLLYGKQSAR